MASLRTESGLDWKIWFVGFGIIALAAAVIVNRDVTTATETELATDDVGHSIQSHTGKNRQASDTLSSILKDK